MAEQLNFSNTWAPQEGPQLFAIMATEVPELLFGGAKGGGKTQFLLGDYLQDVVKYGANWQGILFRQTFPQLDDLINKSQQIYPQTGANFLVGKYDWTWPNGACLRFRALESIEDCNKFQGHERPWIGFDELTHWSNIDPWNYMRTCCRWGACPIPTKRMRGSANPGGVGHNWVYDYFIKDAPKGYEPLFNVDTNAYRIFIPSRLEDNKILMKNDPLYLNNLKGLGSPEMVKAWLEGDWTVVQGAFYGSDWNPELHVVHDEFPSDCSRFISFDWGSSAPFCVGWWVVSNGNLPSGTLGKYPAGALILEKEWYGGKDGKGLNMTPEEVADGIIERTHHNIKYMVVDGSLYDRDGGPSHAERMDDQARKSNFNLLMRRADKRRIQGATMLRQRLRGEDDGFPLIFFHSSCLNTIRTIPTLQHAVRDVEDVDSRGDDHAYDMVRYAIMSRPWFKRIQQVKKDQGLTLNMAWEKCRPEKTYRI